MMMRRRGGVYMGEINNGLDVVKERRPSCKPDAFC